MEHPKDQDVIADNLLQRRRRYSGLLERSRKWYGTRDDISLDALQELADALEELSVAEEELRAQNEALMSAGELVEQERQHYIDLFDALPDAYVITDEKGVIREGNPASGLLFNVELRRLNGKPLAVFIAEQEKRRFRSFMNDAVAHAGPLDFEGTIRPRRASPKPVSVRIVRISADPPRVGWLIRDFSNRPEITRYAERVEVEHNARVAAERAARRFRFLAEVGRVLTAGDREAICHGVARGVVRFVADHCSFYFIEDGALATLTRAERDGVQSGLVDALKKRYRMDITDVDSPIWQTILTGNPNVVPELSGQATDLRWKALFHELRDRGPRHAVVLPLLRRDHCFGAMLVMGTTPQPNISAEDIGVLLETTTRVSLALENAELIEKLQLADREKTEFLRVVSHELRTPLTAVIGYSDLMLAGIPDQLGPTALEYVERVRTSAWHQLAIVEQLLTQARPGQEDLAVKLESVELADIIREACENIIPAAAEAGLALHVDVPQAIRLTTDPDRLRQILINLLWNAVKYTDQGGIEVRVRGSDDRVFISVIDTGQGIPAEALDHVFQPYWRASDRSPGLGLGLSVCRKLAHLLGGELTVESEAGVGSTFTLSLKTE